MLRLTIILCGFLTWACAANAEIAIAVTYLRQEVKRPPTLSNLDPVPADQGQMGAKLGLEDNNTTGGFLGHSYRLEVIDVPIDGDFAMAATEALAKSPYMILDAPVANQLRVADLPSAQDAMLFNVSSADLALRDDACRGNLFHTLPSYPMRSDALMQFALAKRWTDLAMIVGSYPDDLAFADALRKSATKFGMMILVERTWAFDADMRRNAAQEVPLFTEELGE